MKKLILVLLLLPVSLFAQSAFEGTWRADPNAVQFSEKPEVLSLQNGVFNCSTCEPKIADLKANGEDQKVAGSPYFDTMSVKIVDDRTIESTSKKNGKIVGVATRAVSSDGDQMVEDWTYTTESGKKQSGKTVWRRVDPAPDGANKVSGSWRANKLDNASESVLVWTFKSTGDGLQLTDLSGNSYSAKFDGKEYPFKGDPGVTHVVLNRIDDHTIEEVDKRNGKIVGIGRMTLSEDKKTLNVTWEDKLRDRTVRYSAERQEQVAETH